MKRSGKLFKIFALAMALSIALCSCGDSKTPVKDPAPAPSAPTSSGSSTGSEALPKINALEIVTGSATGSWVPIGSAIAEAFNSYYDGFPATAIAGPGSMGNPSMLSQGDGDVSMSYAPLLTMAFAGDAPYEQPCSNLRAIASMQPTVLHWRITENYDIHNVTDFATNKDKLTLGMSPLGNANYYFADYILTECGLDIDDLSAQNIELYFAESSGITEGWKNRQVQSAINVGNLPYSSVTEALTGLPGHLINIDGAVADALTEKYGFEQYTIPAGTYPGQNEDIKTIALKLVVIVRDDISEDIAYNLAKAIYENHESFIDYHGSFAEFNPETMHKDCGIELHPGAIKYYKEVGLM